MNVVQNGGGGGGGEKEEEEERDRLAPCRYPWVRG